jgi:hypothetical protein
VAIKYKEGMRLKPEHCDWMSTVRSTELLMVECAPELRVEREGGRMWDGLRGVRKQVKSPGAAK